MVRSKSQPKRRISTTNISSNNVNNNLPNLNNVSHQESRNSETIFIRHQSSLSLSSAPSSSLESAITTTNTTAYDHSRTSTSSILNSSPSKRRRSSDSTQNDSIFVTASSSNSATVSSNNVPNYKRRKGRNSNSNPFLHDDDDSINDSSNDDDEEKKDQGIEKNARKKHDNAFLFSDDTDDDNDNHDNEIGPEDFGNFKYPSHQASEVQIITCHGKEHYNFIVRYDHHSQNQSEDSQHNILNHQECHQRQQQKQQQQKVSPSIENKGDQERILLQSICINRAMLETSKGLIDSTETRNYENQCYLINTRTGAQSLLEWIVRLQKQAQTGDKSGSNDSNETTTNNIICSNSNYSSILSAIDLDLIQLILQPVVITRTSCNPYNNIRSNNKRINDGQNQLEVPQQPSWPSSFPPKIEYRINIQFHLTKKAYNAICSPVSLGQNILSSTVKKNRRRMKRSKKKIEEIDDIHCQASIVQRVMFDLFPNSIMEDFLRDTCSEYHSYDDNENDDCCSIIGTKSSTERSKRNRITKGVGKRTNEKEKKDDIITAKMVYDAVDNAHLNAHREQQQCSVIDNNNENDGNDDNNGTNENVSSTDESCQIEGLVPRLRKYQHAAVQWMLQRENGKLDDQGWEICWLVIVNNNKNSHHYQEHCSPLPTSIDNKSSTPSGMMRTDLDECNQDYDTNEIITPFKVLRSAHTLFAWRARKLCVYGKDHEVLEQTEDIIFYNPVTGWIVQSYEEARKFTLDEQRESDSTIRGGILAESMGLGKTIELLACILSNPCPETFLSRTKQLLHNAIKQKHDENNIILTNDSRDVKSIPKTKISKFSCYCGEQETSHSLHWVKCSRCGQTMHGVCAGYISNIELIANTLPEIPRICNESHCPFCQYDMGQSSSDDMIGSRATLIVTPPSILNQWEREIKKHTLIHDKNNESSPGRPLKVLVYPGVKGIRSSSHAQAVKTSMMKMLLPNNLADADIVLTTFDTLRGEIGHCSDNPFVGSRRMRAEKKYRVVPSPLVSIKWWRICLDEAQRIETPTAASAKMVLNLSSQNKWCVSGTPIGRGKIDDLYGLYLFLNAKPFCYRQCFNTYLKPQFRDITDRIKHSTFDLMWRSTKANEFVRNQMGIPEQVEKKIILHFSSVERHFYKCQLENTILAANTASTSKSRKGKGPRKKEIEDLSIHLHRLRAACCHPQVGSSGISRIVKRKIKSKQSEGLNGVLNMAQILDKLIDDSKVKAEESQRVFTLHTNALACLNKLKSEARTNGDITCDDNEIYLLKKCCDHYFEALNQAERNSLPSPLVGEAVLSGCIGFQSTNSVVRDGTATLLWRMRLNERNLLNKPTFPELWSKFDFTASTKKISTILVRPKIHNIQNDLDNSYNHQIIYPKDCVLQVSNAAMGGAFVDAIPFSLPCPNERMGRNDAELEWNEFHGLRPNKSKSWRVLVKTFHSHKPFEIYQDLSNIFVGIDIQLMEPDIYSDNLQRIHILHNVSLSLTTLLQKYALPHQQEIRKASNNGFSYSKVDIEKKLKKIHDESKRLESHYIEAARVIQEASNARLEDNTEKRKEILSELKDLSTGRNSSDQPWSVDLLSWCHLYGNVQLEQMLCAHVERRLFELFDDPSQTFQRRSFPQFHNLDGLNLALSMRVEKEGEFYNEMKVPNCILQVRNLSSHPSEAEVFENSHCRKCRVDWNQRGPICQCCKIEDNLSIYRETLKESEINCVLKAMMEWFNDNLARMKRPHNNSKDKSININLSNIHQKMEKFFLFKTAATKELESARTKWRTHFDLLSDIDELNQCKRSMRLSYKNENISGLTDHEKAFIVQPCDIAALIMDHTSKQAMAEAILRQNKEKLRFLKNQHWSIKEGNDDRCCTICLSPFGDDDRAVLRCGHMYHYSPCVEKLLSRGNGTTVTCPMRCAIRTRKEDILIASEKRRDDGSKTTRKIQGCWGTKVDRLIADVMEVEEKAEKSIVFSQWDDMLTIMEHALTANNIQFIRSKTIKKFGDDMKLFRTNHCNVLLMHIKHGAEGLTLVEANHVFMIEPLLNHSVDSQAINRIHRIGQTQKTYVHRYLISDTIEVKIDKMRVEREENNPDNEDIVLARNKVKQKCDAICAAGGLDGGFNETELQELLC